MADDRVVAKIVNEFFLSTCLLRRRLNMDTIAVMKNSSDVIDREYDKELDGDTIIALSAGSVAEFYIEPMLSCIGDVDIMYHSNCDLAIPRGHLPPTQFPDEFYGDVRVWEITDSQFPGYVYLVLTYVLLEITDDGKHIAVQCPGRYFAAADLAREVSGGFIRGPALYVKKEINRLQQFLIGSVYYHESLNSSDFVICFRCLSWPTQSADWPSRRRNYGWPDSATVDRVVSNGCDVVRVSHRLCMQDQWMNKRQFRLSFSRAEIILLNSWMPVQQIVYHMLRFFTKTERFTDTTDSTGSKILSNYIVKTLVLWACEMKARSWWIDELNLVGVCVKLLHILADCLTGARCPHYFINNCNLFDVLGNSDLTQKMANRLMSVTEVWLAEWFVNNYTCKCVDPIVSRVLRLFDDISTHVKLQNAVSWLVEY